MREELYNGINIQKPWPPRMKEKEQALKKNIDRIPETICYLSNPPKVIPIHVGRQLFVDDFLIDTSTLQRKYYYPEPYVGNPILKPQTKIEKNEGCCPVAATFTDGVFYDSKDGLYKMWYQAGWFDGTAYAEESISATGATLSKSGQGELNSSHSSAWKMQNKILAIWSGLPLALQSGQK